MNSEGRIESRKSRATTVEQASMAHWQFEYCQSASRHHGTPTQLHRKTEESCTSHRSAVESFRVAASIQMPVGRHFALAPALVIIERENGHFSYGKPAIVAEAAAPIMIPSPASGTAREKQQIKYTAQWQCKPTSAPGVSEGATCLEMNANIVSLHY